MVSEVVARVQVTVEISVKAETWNEGSSVDQVHREAEELAVKRITDLCQRYVRLIGTPMVEAVMTRKRQR